MVTAKSDRLFFSFEYHIQKQTNCQADDEDRCPYDPGVV